MSRTTISLGIIGIGYWGPNYARIISQLDNVNLSWCADIDKDALYKFSKIYPQTKTSQTIEPLLKDGGLDGVIIVTPAQNHFEVTKKFLTSGKDCLVEKPLTNNLKRAQVLVQLAKDKKRVLMVDHTYVFNPAVRKLKELVDSGEVGKIYYIHGNYNALGPIRKDVSSMWDLPHFIYVVNYILGKTPLWVQAAGKDYIQKKMQDVVFLTFEYPNRILFNLSCSWIDPVKTRKLVIVGEKKMVVFDDMEREEKIKIYNKGVDVLGNPNFANLESIIRDGDTLIPKLNLTEPLKEVALQFISSIKSRNNNFSNGVDGINLVKTLHISQRSLNTGKRVYFK